MLRTVGLFGLTALAEIVGCYLPYLWLHPTAAGRTYAAYGGVYVTAAVFWLWCIDGVKPDKYDLLGVAITLVGMSIIAFGPRDG